MVMLDVRNDYEWDAGHFRGAARPAEEEFNDTPVCGCGCMCVNASVLAGGGEVAHTLSECEAKS